MSNTGFTARLAQWIAQAPRNWQADAMDQAQRAIADTIGCIIAGVDDEAVRRVRAGLGRWGGGGEASQAGTAGGVDAPWAALLNGTSAHALDFDDVLDPAASHVSAVMVPALLALGEQMDASGADLVDAYIVGVEVQECLAEAVNMTHYSRGWHTTLTLGAPSAAAACARLLRLDAQQSCHAMSIATSMAAGFKRQFGTNTKPLHAGLGAKNGILAAQMAAAGVTADPAIFEGERGFLDLMAGDGAAGFGSVLQRLDGPPAIVSPGVWLKRYPCCASTHRVVDAVIGMMQANGLAVADIVGIDTQVSEPAVRNLMYVQPRDEMQARFSMAYCVAAAALDKDLRLATFRRTAMDRSDIADFIPRVAMSPDPAQPGDMPSTTRSWATTTLHMGDGRSFTRKVVDPKGYPGNPLSEQELEAKFRDCASAQAADVAASYADWRGIASTAKIRPLCAGLRTLAKEV
ncbi:MmgE/PrpD family protein [Variovorax terrae]|uniref:MmgE/PrpD family protein n=1 Tax=Variovorax terrae TaxID=2923278 RepID=A0A9X1VV96_9BURK|nr:MmgE/PrpD family protein [Variovorax terrae]MCJ0764037.1 MmgE/PrpD family protein [Variovorax terrae]